MRLEPAALQSRVKHSTTEPLRSLACSKRVSEYDQEIRQSQIADKPMAPRGRATQQSRDTRKQLSKATSSLFPIKMIAILEGT